MSHARAVSHDLHSFFARAQADFMFFSSEYELQLRQLLPTMETKDSEVEEKGKVKDEKTSADTSEDSAKKAVVENANERTATKTPGFLCNPLHYIDYTHLSVWEFKCLVVVLRKLTLTVWGQCVQVT